MIYLTRMNLLAQTTIQSFFILTPPWFWWIIGVVLCLMDLVILQTTKNGYKFLALLIGIGAFITSITVWQVAELLGFDWRYVMYEDFNIQVMYWMGVCLALVIWVRPTLIQRKRFVIPEATEATTVTEIFPGETGQVLYEGCFWRARCADSLSQIKPHQKVYVLHRDGNTLIVASEKIFQQ